MTLLSQLLMAVMMLALLTACDNSRTSRARVDRGDSRYRSAMEAYSAGNIDKAIDGLNGAIEADPLNASAHFMVATLLQDVRKDYFGALLNYHEYLLLEPKGEKATIAKERLDRATKAYEAMVAAKSQKEVVVSEDLKKLNARIDELEKTIEANDKQIAALNNENARLKTLLSRLDEDTEAEKATIDVGDLLDDDNEGEQLGLGEEVGDVVVDMDAEEADAGETSKLLPDQAADAKEKKKAAKESKKAAELANSTKKIERPEEYVVQEGDSLYKIALRFYGKTSEWKRIREANKSVISTDGRVNAGQKIKLP